MQERVFNAKTSAIFLLALGVRLLGIASRPIWYDEAFSILFSEKGPGAMLYGTLAPTGAGSADIHPLGYYTLLWLWIKVFGNSLVSARFLSILAGLVTILLVYLIAREITSDSRTAEVSMLCAALAPFQVHYAQEIRMYAFLAMWLLLATYAYLRGKRDHSWMWWGLFSISAALAQYSHNLAAFYLVPLALLPLLQKDWRMFRATILAGLGALILYSPWLIQLPAQFSKIQSFYWVARPDVSKLFTLILVFITNTPVPTQLIPVLLLIALLVLIVGVIQTIRVSRQASGDPGRWIAYLAFVPPLFLFVFSQWRPVYIERALLPSGAIFCIWLAWVIRNTNMQRVVQYILYSLLLFSSVLGIYQHLTYRDFPYGPFQALDASLLERVDPEGVIVHSNKLSMLPAMLFDRELDQSFIGDEPGSPADTLAAATQQVLQIEAKEDIQSATADAQQIWYIIFQRSIDEFQVNGSRTHPDLEYLDAHYRLQAVENWDGVRLFHYTSEP